MGKGKKNTGIHIHDITEIKGGEKLLAQELDILQAVMNGAKNSHLAYLDRDFNFVRVNKTYAGGCGYLPEQMIGKNHFALYPNAENEEIFARVRDTGEPVEHHDKPFEFPDQPERGVTYWDWTLNPVKDSNGLVVGLVFSLFETTERKRAQESLRENEERVRHTLESIMAPEGDIGNLELADIIDAPAIQSLMDDFYKLAPMPMAIIDLKGKVLVGKGWQDICTKFHRIHPETNKNCIESDLQLTEGIPTREFKLYKCKNNMWDVATPITVGDRHLGNLFSGQFFFDDEQPDHEFFKSQAKLYCFNEDDYIAALERVPRLSREFLATGMEYFTKFASLISKLSYSNIKLARLLTERDSLMDSLRESEERLNRAQEIAHLGSWELDLVNNHLSWSDEVYRIFGLEPQEFGASYEAFLQAVHPEDRTAVDTAYSGSLRDGCDSYEIEHRIVRKGSGEVRVVHEKCEHLRDESGRLIRSVGMVLDITERNRAEEVLRETAVELQDTNIKLLNSRRAAINLTKAAVAARRRAEEVSAELLLESIERKGAESRLDLLVDTAVRLLAADAPQQIVDSLCGKVMEFLDCHVFFNFLVVEGADRLHLNACAGIPEEEKQKIQWLDYGAAVCGCATRDACRIVVEDIPNSSDPRTELVKSYGIQAYACHPLVAQGRVLGALSFGTRTRTRFSDDDLSLMKAVADQVAIAMERKRVEEDLRRAKEAAEASTRAKSQFLANMSHELRTPMTGVLGMLDLALGTSLNKRQRECISTAHNSARSLLRIINDILDLTKIEAGRLSIEEMPFNLRECVSCAIEVLGTVAMRKRLELLHSLASDLPHNVMGDQLRLRQVLINLVGNAVKFTDAGKVELRVTAGGSAPDGRREITFSVSDTGIGIPAHKKHLLFNPFSQVDDSNTRTYGGSGLGLVISKEIVELMGGKIGFESEEGRGSTFFFTVPLGEVVLERDNMGGPRKPDAVESFAEQPVAGERPRLLLAEDDPVIRKILEMMLVRANFDLDFAENGEKAVEKWEQGEYDLILMDVQMPLMDGFAATRIIREQEQARGGHTIVVAMTAHALKQDQDRCFAAGMDAYISKPIDLKKSIEVITDLLNKKNPSG